MWLKPAWCRRGELALGIEPEGLIRQIDVRTAATEVPCREIGDCQTTAGVAVLDALLVSLAAAHGQEIWLAPQQDVADRLDLFKPDSPRYRQNGHEILRSIPSERPSE